METLTNAYAIRSAAKTTVLLKVNPDSSFKSQKKKVCTGASC